VPEDDGNYRLSGNKMWIPGGSPGVKGISLFVVPRFLVGPDGSLGERNDVVLAGLDHEMG
jgi:alkylation response protein AidB-like acyl-CoA dehydrogenase